MRKQPQYWCMLTNLRTEQEKVTVDAIQTPACNRPQILFLFPQFQGQQTQLLSICIAPERGANLNSEP
jgi:hypothetical protein